MARTKRTATERGSAEELQRRLVRRVQWWASAGFAFLTTVVSIRLGWEVALSDSLEAIVTSIISMLSVIGIGGLIIFFIFQPRRLTSPVVARILLAVVGLGMIGGLLHYVRFVFISPVPPISRVIATGLLLATVCGFIMLVYGARWLRLKRRGFGSSR